MQAYLNQQFPLGMTHPIPRQPPAHTLVDTGEDAGREAAPAAAGGCWCLVLASTGRARTP